MKSEVIANPRAERVRRVSELADRKGRKRSGRFMVEGPQSVRELLSWHPDIVEDLYVEVVSAEPDAAFITPTVAQMAESYFQQDADPVKSSGIQSKKVSYKWRTVTKDDMKDFNDAWWQIVKANPQIALDALFAECFGYFNVTDLPYVSMDYYVNNDYVQSDNEWIHLYNHQWRNQVAGFAKKWGQIPVLGWVTHGNLYVTLTLLIGAAEVVLRRWRSLSWHLPLLLLMGVMITAPANNFERHMLPIAFVFGFLCLEFWRESRAARLAAREASYVVTSTAGKRRIGGRRIDRQQSDKQDADERYLDGRQLDGQEKES